MFLTLYNMDEPNGMSCVPGGPLYLNRGSDFCSAERDEWVRYKSSSDNVGTVVL